MAILPKAVILAKFQNQDKPTEQDFVDFYESVVADVEVAATGTAEAKVDSDIKAETPAPGRYISPNTLLEAIQYYGETIEKFLNSDDNTGADEGPTRNVLTNLGADIDDDGTVNDKGKAGFMKLFRLFFVNVTRFTNSFGFNINNFVNEVKVSLVPNMDSRHDLGTFDKRWANFYADVITSTNNTTVGGILNVTGHTNLNTATLDGLLRANGGFNLAGGTLTLPARSIENPDIASNAITADKIAGLSIHDRHINANAQIAQTKISGLSTALGSKLDASSFAGHNHNTLYYTESEIDNFFSGLGGTTTGSGVPSLTSNNRGKRLVHWDSIRSKPTSFTPTSHTHTEYATSGHGHNLVGDVTGTLGTTKIASDKIFNKHANDATSFIKSVKRRVELTNVARNLRSKTIAVKLTNVRPPIGTGTGILVLKLYFGNMTSLDIEIKMIGTAVSATIIKNNVHGERFVLPGAMESGDGLNNLNFVSQRIAGRTISLPRAFSLGSTLLFHIRREGWANFGNYDVTSSDTQTIVLFALAEFPAAFAFDTFSLQAFVSDGGNYAGNGNAVDLGKSTDLLG